ncbi:hypothetical protein F4818DRAFT_440228 [Hypoxylon cercidicola]|nr:hypothetical protein F4818DRAFT_440228 [Hypoxylon cercidicola]
MSFEDSPYIPQQVKDNIANVPDELHPSILKTLNPKADLDTTFALRDGSTVKSPNPPLRCLRPIHITLQECSLGEIGLGKLLAAGPERRSLFVTVQVRTSIVPYFARAIANCQGMEFLFIDATSWWDEHHTETVDFAPVLLSVDGHLRSLAVTRADFPDFDSLAAALPKSVHKRLVLDDLSTYPDDKVWYKNLVRSPLTPNFDKCIIDRKVPDTQFFKDKGCTVCD